MFELKSGTADAQIYTAYGQASFYAAWLHGHRTASGERLNNYFFTAAHRFLPFNTVLKVSNTDNDSFVFLRINDRGPYRRDRIIDVTHAAAKKLDMVRFGVKHVKLECPDTYPDTLTAIRFLKANNINNLRFRILPDPSHIDSTVSWIYHIKPDTGYFVEADIPFDNSPQLDEFLCFMNYTEYKNSGFLFIPGKNGSDLWKIYIGNFSSRSEADRCFQTLVKICKSNAYLETYLIE